MVDSQEQTPVSQEAGYYEDPARASYERHDTRWEAANQLRDWLILFAIGTLHFIWMLIVFLVEPGIR